MIRLTRRILLSTCLCAFILVQKSEAQNIIDPSDPVLEYDPANPPTPPDYFHPLVKWVRTLNVENGAVQYQNPGWNSDVYKAYNYNGLSFRVEFPKSYNPTASDGKKYPIIIFLHGQGENDQTYLGPPPPGAGSYNYDNQWQLLQGPQQFDNAIQNGTYDGYVLAPQLQNNISGSPTVYYQGVLNDIMNIVKHMIANNKVDPFHIVVNGLSEGGVGAWEMLDLFPTYISSAIPMSSPVDFVDWSNTGTYFSSKRFTPIWVSQGGQDVHPTPAETQRIADTMAKYGADFRESFYPDNGHNTWYNVWAEHDFWPFINNAYSSNPWMIGGLKNFWPGQPINETIGITTGFTAYEWRRNGSTIAGATSNTLNVTAPGIYDARVLRDGVWSDYSHVPINIRPGYYEAESYVDMSGVVTLPTSDISGDKEVANIDNGDWMDYTLNVYAPGTYALLLRVSASGEGGIMEVRNSDSAVLATVNVPPTGSYQTWETISTTVTFTSAGVQNIRLKSTSNIPWNINWFQFTTASNSPLPVKFEYFNTECKGSAGVNLQWKTAQEQNTNRFSVQRSVDGISWNEIGSVGAAGQSTQQRSYVFVDKTAGAANLYRIVEYDFNGQTTISSIVRSNCGVQGEVRLYPNPSNGRSALNIPLTQSSNVSIRIMDSKGALVQQRQIMLPAGNNTIPLNVSSYPEGVYSIQVQYNTEIKTIKMIKQ